MIHMPILPLFKGRTNVTISSISFMGRDTATASIDIEVGRSYKWIFLKFTIFVPLKDKCLLSKMIISNITFSLICILLPFIVVTNISYYLNIFVICHPLNIFNETVQTNPCGLGGFLVVYPNLICVTPCDYKLKKNQSISH